MNDKEAARLRQSHYYERTAASYDSAHVSPGDGHYTALEYVAGLCDALGAESLLDVGAGTGRAIRFLAHRRPGMKMAGLEPSESLRVQAVAAGGGDFYDGLGERLPFEDGAFDVVLATAVLHHVPDPTVVIAEMQRVASKAVMISDANRFGQGSRSGRVLKALACRSGVWRSYVWARTAGRGFYESEGDGIFYSYSLHDSVSQINDWATRSFIIPTQGSSSPWFGSLFTADLGLLVGVREPCRSDWAGTSS